MINLKFRKKPVVIEAVQWTGENLREVITFTDGPPNTRSRRASMAWENYEDLVRRDGLKIFTLEGAMMASPGDWIIKGVKGEFYPCKPDIFDATYERASIEASIQPDTSKLAQITVQDAAKVPEIVALIEAATPFVSPVQNADYGRQLRQYEALCTAMRALATIGEEPRHD